MDNLVRFGIGQTVEADRIVRAPTTKDAGIGKT
jgi:hypothetical protein